MDFHTTQPAPGESHLKNLTDVAQLGFQFRSSTSPAFWLAMFAASAFGTVLGDFWAEGLHLGLVLSFGTLVVITGRSPEGARDRGVLLARNHLPARRRPVSVTDSSTSLGCEWSSLENEVEHSVQAVF
jgi:hypothetical protein